MGTGTRQIFIQRVGYAGATTHTLPAPLTSLLVHGGGNVAYMKVVKNLHYTPMEKKNKRD